MPWLCSSSEVHVVIFSSQVTTRGNDGSFARRFQMQIFLKVIDQFCVSIPRVIHSPHHHLAIPNWYQSASVPVVAASENEFPDCEMGSMLKGDIPNGRISSGIYPRDSSFLSGSVLFRSCVRVIGWMLNSFLNEWMNDERISKRVKHWKQRRRSTYEADWEVYNNRQRYSNPLWTLSARSSVTALDFRYIVIGMWLEQGRYRKRSR